MSHPTHIDAAALAEEIQSTVDEFNRLAGLAAALRVKVEVVAFTEARAPRTDRAFLEATITFGGLD